MTTYAIIDANSGFFWGAIDATSPIEACRLLDHAIDPHAAGYRTYAEVNRLDGGLDGYYVHHITDVANADGINAMDGQDPDVIEEIESYPCVATVLVSEG